MEPAEVTVSENQQLCADSLPFARSYQLEALEMALKKNTIVYLETGSGKTLIAIMLLKSYAYLLRKPSPYVAVFLVPTVVLVTQQGDALMMHTDLKVGNYWGEMGVDYWDAATWQQQVDDHEVLVMTPAILLAALRHSFLKIEMIKVLIFDECHNARAKHPYACIMREFYHRQLTLESAQLPRIFGMTASPIKTKGSGAEFTWKMIRDLENLMNSKVYTCVSEAVLAKYIPFSTPKLKIYQHVDIPCTLFVSLVSDLIRLKDKYEDSISKSSLSDLSAGSAKKKLSKLYSSFIFCLSELGVWLAFKAAEFLSSEETDFFSWGELDVCAQTIVRNFSLGASKVFSARIPSGSHWSLGGDIHANVNAGYLTSKVNSLIESLLEYRDLKDLRCIIFVERIITAIVLRSLLNELLPELSGWKTEYTAGHSSKLQSQSRNVQNKIVEEFRKGVVNIIVATSILEEGLDVQSCNLVIRFDPSATVCSFIQSRGRARMQNSHFILMVGSGDASTLTRMQNYMKSGEIMRQESLRNASIPCSPLDDELHDEPCYKVETTGAVVTLSSSVSLLYFYCSRLPSDGYYKPSPRCVIEKETETCTLYLPKNCPLQKVISVKGNTKILKQLACLEACKELHREGALTDNLVPDIVEEEAIIKELECQIYTDEESKYFPPELVSHFANDTEAVYYCYIVDLQHDSYSKYQLRGIILAVRTRLKFDDERLIFDLDVDKGSLLVQVNYSGVVRLTSEEILRCQRFQVSLFRILLDRDPSKLQDALAAVQLPVGSAVSDYLLLPSLGSTQNPQINWECMNSVLFPSQVLGDKHIDCCSTQGRKRSVNTKTGVVCSCMLENSLVCTPHNGYVYCVTSFLDNLDCNSLLEQRTGEFITYKEYYKKRHGINLCFEGEPLLRGKRIFKVHNYLQRCRSQKAKDSTDSSVELPPELCSIIMSPISISTLYTYSYLPSVMHRVESLIMASNLKKMHSDQCTQNIFIPTAKVLEAITTKKCVEKFHLESLETLGDSFLKYAASIQLFKTYENHHEGLLTVKKNKVISNAALCKLGCARKIPGFIRNEPFDLKGWLIPGDNSQVHNFDEEVLMPSVKMYSRGRQKIKSKRVADVVEALIGAFLSSGGEVAALSFMKWLGIDIDFVDAPSPWHFPMNAEKVVNVQYLESLLHYKFHDPSLLVEALTHGSYMLPEIPRCYQVKVLTITCDVPLAQNKYPKQRLEFLGDAVLDYAVTAHLYFKYPGLSPGLITDLRSASVNNECYAQAAVKARLHKHILHASQDLQRQIINTVLNFEKLDPVSTFGWESETTFPKVLGDVIESLAGAIFVDSGFNKDIVFQSVRTLLEPLITPDTVKLHPVRELSELCDQKGYIKKKNVVSRENGVAYITVEVEADGVSHKFTCSERDKKMAEKVACKNVLKLLKECASDA